MGKTNQSLATAGILSLFTLATACTHKVQIEPSDKPFVVNLNVKIDHDIRVKIEDQNQDLLNLEEQLVPAKSKKKPG